MAITKARTSIWSATTLTAGAGNTTSSWVDLSAVYSSTVDIVLTNGATGPTVAAQVQVNVANDYNAGSPTLITNLGSPMVGLTSNNGVAYFSVELPIGVAAVRLVAGSNTAQNVTVDADVGKITAV